MTTIRDVQERLSEVRPHGTSKHVIELGLVRGVDLHEGVVTIKFVPGNLPPPLAGALRAEMERAVGALEGVTRVVVEMPAAGPGPAAPAPAQPIPGVADIIAVSSAKGGVGKSTVAVNLALALRARGKRTGLLDADVYGPSLPLMLGVTGRPRMADEKRIHPIEQYGLQVMSMGFFLDDASPVIWRGPMVMGLVRQFLKDVEWHDLDVLVIDLPPGTGDAQLTLVQQVPLAGGVIVTTPQDVALLDVQRGIAMFQQVNTPILGVVENMSYFECEACGKKEDLFGAGGGRRISDFYGVPLLGQVPLVQAVRQGGDAGRPIVLDQPQHPVSQAFLHIADNVLDQIEAAREPAPRIIG